MSIKRYDLISNESDDGMEFHSLEEYQYGDYVKYSDYEELEKERDELRAWKALDATSCSKN